MKGIVFLALLILPMLSFARIEMKSIYFDKYSETPTGLSKGKLEKLKESIERTNFQVIEINSFSNIEGGFEKNKKLSQGRVNYILNLLDVESNSITINTYGNKRVSINFNPQSWNRVDVYYNVEELAEIKIDTANVKKMNVIEHIDLTSPDELKITSTPNEKSERTVPKLSEIIAEVPIVLPIKFEGGTNEIIKSDQEYLDHLYNTLSTHKSLKAHIRGHVCCGNNRRISKQRAKIIYDYLVDKGIEKDRLTFAGYSNSDPLVFPERTSEDRKKNRRVDIIFKK